MIYALFKSMLMCTFFFTSESHCLCLYGHKQLYCSDLLAGWNAVLGLSDALPQRGVSFPCQGFQYLLLNMVQMFDYLPEKTLLRPYQHLNHL